MRQNAPVSTPTQQWFAGDPPSDTLDEAFLTRVREEASHRDMKDLRPTETSSIAARDLRPLVLMVDVPQMPDELQAWSHLAVCYWPPESSSYPRLEGSWGSGHFLDDHDGNDRDCLTVDGVPATPEDLASFSAQWLTAQLARPIECDQWLIQGEVLAQQWRFADTGRVLSSPGKLLRRAVRREPDRTHRVRP